jgi:hypothetical protein
VRGLLLDPQTGRPQEAVTADGLPLSMVRNLEAGWRIRGLTDGQIDVLETYGDRLPAVVRENLERSRRAFAPFAPRNSAQTWRETLYATIADGAQVLNTVTETILVPNFTLPANYLYPGRVLKYTLWIDNSTVITTPGTITHRLRYGGVAGTSLAASGAYAPDPTAASTTVSGYIEYYFVCRAVGTAAASFTMGRMWLSDNDDATATTVVGNLNMHVIPSSAPAAVNIDTTAANALSPTVTHSVATATTQTTCHIAILESLS